ncbi:MAG: fumarylacetoacetate hydrolase family protein [Thermoflavifilum aggregans]|nr:fumarylacetoacetate hydrolase family protein [Thermoflavifilum aggregans]
MKLCRLGSAGNEKPAIWQDGRWLDVSAFGEDYDESFFETDGMVRLQNWLQSHLSECPEISSPARIGPCVKRPSKIICIGLNYADHARETGAKIPSSPVIFLKAPSALCGVSDPLIIPEGSVKTDWEVELAVVIGRKASHIPESAAMQYVAGYAMMNDYSERYFQLEDTGQWTKGKSFDSFAPLGPWLVTADEIADPHQLHLWLSVNDEMQQNSHTREMIFKIPFLIHYLSKLMTLFPGDIISTGTPAGVGMGKHPQKFLKPGDIIAYGIEGLGEARQQAVAWRT